MQDWVNAEIARFISIHALRVEGDRSVRKAPWRSLHFYPRPPGGGRRRLHIQHCLQTQNFYPRPPGGGRLQGCSHYSSPSFYFYPRPPGGGRHCALMFGEVDTIYFYPRPPGGGRPFIVLIHFSHFRISIHALRVEGDNQWKDDVDGQITFLSTPSGWRATCVCSAVAFGVKRFLSTPSGWRATHHKHQQRLQYVISIHALRVEGDSMRVLALVTNSLFLSTPSGWRATVMLFLTHSCSLNFYPRPPGGGRQLSSCKILRTLSHFYPRPPGGGRRLQRRGE